MTDVDDEQVIDEGIQINELPRLKYVIGKISGKELIPVDLPQPITYPSGEVVQTLSMTIQELCNYIKAQINISSANPTEPPSPEPQEEKPTPQKPQQVGDVGWYKPVKRTYN